MSKVLGFAILALMLAVGGLGSAVPAAAEEAPLVVDLAAEGALVEEHTARLLWNLTTDNLDTRQHPNVQAWNSLYLEQPEAVSGRVIVDFENRTITGQITERWTTTGAPSWTTTLDTGWTAVINDGLLEPDGDGWEVTGSVAVSYDTNVTADESPSECDGAPCYLCKNRVCEVGGTAGGTASLEGWIDGRTLSLAFADGLGADVSQMDFSGLRRTEFFMSRFSITITPPPSPAGSPEDPAGEEAEATESGEVGDVTGPAGEAGDETAGAEQVGDDGAAVPEAGDEATGPDGERAATEQADGAAAPNVVPAIGREDGASRTPMLVALVIALLLLVFLGFRALLTRPGRLLTAEVAETVRDTAGRLVTDPHGLLHHASDQAEKLDEDHQRAAKAAAGPQLTSTGGAVGEAHVSKPVEAVTPSGATQTLPAGTSYPAGVTIEWYGKSWTPVQIGSQWWWVPKNDPGVTVTGEVSLPHGTPEKVSPPPYVQFRLSEKHEVRAGPTSVLLLEPGDYGLGGRVARPDGDYYSVHPVGADGKWGHSTGWVTQSSLPKDSGYS